MLFELPYDRIPQVLVISNSNGNLHQLRRQVTSAKPNADVLGITDLEELQEDLTRDDVDLVVLDERVFFEPEFTNWFHNYRQDERQRLVPAIVITNEHQSSSRVRLIESGADLLLLKPVPIAEFRAAVEVQLERKFMNDELEYLERVLLGFIQAVEARDAYTAGHTKRVTVLAYLLAETMKLSTHDKGVVLAGGLMHDVGKIGVPDSILRKTGPLTPDEFNEVQRHPVIGEKILTPMVSMKSALPGIRSHHERWDGKGYPDGLSGHDIPFIARIIGVADGIEAMLSDRPYRNGFGVDKVREILIKNKGVQWDPEIVDIALKVNAVEIGKSLVSDPEYAKTVNVTPSVLKNTVREISG